MMNERKAMYRVSTKENGDWGETHFNVIAKDDIEAWKKACKLELPGNIERIYIVKYL